jgi:hypothetical protein
MTATRVADYASDLEAIYCGDNGFTLYRSMLVSHSAILSVLFAGAKNALSMSNDPHIVDLGAGNGALLRRICNLVPNSYACGIELDQTKVLRGTTVLAHERVRLWHGDVYNPAAYFESAYDVAIVSALHLFTPPRSNCRLRASLASYARRILLYAYYDSYRALEQQLAEPTRFGVEFEPNANGHSLLGEQRVFVRMARLIN